MTLTEADAASFCSLMAGSIASYARLDELAEPKLPVKYPRCPGYRPPAEENPYNAWYWKTNITGAKGGVLAGERVAVKDNICVAGVPMMNGSRVLEGYVPEINATVVTRVLDAGGVIAGSGRARLWRRALVIAMLLGSTLLAQAEPIDRDKWIAQTARASKSCLAKFRQKFGEDKGHNYSRCVTDQTNKAIDDCVGSSEFSSCVLEKSLKVLEVCDLSSC